MFLAPQWSIFKTRRPLHNDEDTINGKFAFNLAKNQIITPHEQQYVWFVGCWFLNIHFTPHFSSQFSFLTLFNFSSASSLLLPFSHTSSHKMQREAGKTFNFLITFEITSPNSSNSGSIPKLTSLTSPNSNIPKLTLPYSHNLISKFQSLRRPVSKLKSSLYLTHPTQIQFQSSPHPTPIF